MEDEDQSTRFIARIYVGSSPGNDPFEAQGSVDWSGLQAAFHEGRIITGVVRQVVKGGLRVDIGARAFLPAFRSGVRQHSEMRKLIGQEIRCRIIKLDIESKNIVVDRRAVLEKEELPKQASLPESIHEGLVVLGTVKSLTGYGAFIDIGGIDGLLHVSDMSWSPVKSPADMVRVGDEIEVKVLKVDAAKQRVSLGTKQLERQPPREAATQILQSLRISHDSDPSATVSQMAGGLAERAWMVQTAVSPPFILEGELKGSEEEIVQYAVNGSAVQRNVSNVLDYHGGGELVMLGLYPSGFIRAIAGWIRATKSGPLLVLEDLLALIDPAALIEKVPSGGLQFSVRVLALQPR